MYLAKLMGEYTGEDFTHLSDEAEITEIIGSQAQEWEKLRGNVEKLPDPVGPEYWDVYDEAEGHPYLRKRGIEDSTAELLRLKIDPDDHGVERVLFPVCQLDGGLQGFTGRATNDISEPKVRDYFGLNKRMLLLGADLANQQDKTARLVLVEGPFDCARLWQYGVPAVAALHSRITSAQAKILKKLKRPVVVMLDNDVAGRNGTIEVKRLVHGHIPLLKVRYPEGVKDPDGLTEIQLRRMLDSTRLL
jgi:DNA primase